MSSIVISEFAHSHTNAVVDLINRNDMEAKGSLPPWGVVATHEDAVVGYVGSYPSYANNAWIAMFVVEEILRGKGLGFQLLKAAVIQLKNKGCTHVAAHVQTINGDAVRLYDRLGISLDPVYLMEHSIDEVLSKMSEHEAQSKQAQGT